MPAVFFAILQRLLTYIVVKLIAALGLAFITYTGFSVGLLTIKNYVVSNFNSIPADAFQILMMAGLGQVLGMVFGAFALNAAMSSISKISFISKQ